MTQNSRPPGPSESWLSSWASFGTGKNVRLNLTVMLTVVAIAATTILYIKQTPLQWKSLTSGRQQAKLQAHIRIGQGNGLYDRSSTICKYEDSSSNHPCLCVGMQFAPQFPLSLRPKIAIIIIESKDRQGRAESSHVVDNFVKYCKLHGCLPKHVLIDPDPQIGFFGARWEALLSYWLLADWLLMVDSDTLVSNLTNAIDQYLDVPEHIVLHLRFTREVAAGVVAARTSDFGRCFIKRWIDIMRLRVEYRRAVNADNGALLLTLAEYLNPELAQQLATGSTSVFEYVSNFESLFPHLANAHKLAPIRIYMPFGGFWRQHEGVAAEYVHSSNTTCNYDESIQKAVFFRCWWNDVLVSGWKAIGTNMWANSSAIATTARCPVNSLAESLEVAKLCCYHQYPGCVDEQGVNVCKRQAWCQDPHAGPYMQVRADIGYGICWNHKPYDKVWRRSSLLGNATGC